MPIANQKSIDMRTCLILLLFFYANVSTAFGVEIEKEAFITQLMSQMTLAEKVGQMNQYNVFVWGGAAASHFLLFQLVK